MKRPVQVEEGQCYRKILEGRSVRSSWKVSNIVMPIEDLPHAHLVNIDDPGDVRTVSCATIADRHYFEPMQQPQAEVA